MFGKAKKLEEKVSSTLYDLTHLEINTIVKDEMVASKAPDSPRLMLHAIATKYHGKLMTLGEKYKDVLPPAEEGVLNIFRGKMVFLGSGYDSFKELSDNAERSIGLLRDYASRVPQLQDQVSSDIMMLQRIHNISDDIRRILRMDGVDPCGDKKVCDFDDAEAVRKFRNLTAREADQYELNLDLRQLMVFKKANDIGTERVMLQTIIGMDGDITTRVAKAFADHPITFINQLHHEAIGISVDFWKNLITVVVKLGENIIGMFHPKT